MGHEVIDLLAPIQHFAEISLSDANAALVRWGHQMGPCNRPNTGIQAHGMFVHGSLVAVTVSARLVAATCAGLTRSEAIELARLCAAGSLGCRVPLRLWRDLVFPALCTAHGYEWAVSYQDEHLHTGNTYRFDGWVRLDRSHSGPDTRTGRKGRQKTIWGWHPDPAERRKRTAPPGKTRTLQAAA